jgi:very-short-patch-repair endonuclease
MHGKVATPDALIAEIAERQHGVVSMAQVHGIGVSDDAVRARVLAGRFHRVHRGVYAVGHAALSFEGRCTAAVLAMGGGHAPHGPILDCWGGAVSHRSAAVLWELLPGGDAPVDVIVPGVGGRAKRLGMRVHRSRSLASTDVTLRRGIPVTTPARTIADLRRHAAGPAGRASDRELRRAVRQAGVLGLPIGDDPDCDRTRSDLERAFLTLCHRYDLSHPAVNVRVGPYLVDFIWRDRRLIVETDGYRFHRGKAAFHLDRQRDLELTRRGYEVIRVSELQVEREPDRVAETLATVLWAGDRDPPPANPRQRD